jgi:hypothetical protein
MLRQEERFTTKQRLDSSSKTLICSKLETGEGSAMPETKRDEWAEFEQEWDKLAHDPSEDPTVPLPPREDILQSLRDSQTRLEQASERVDPIVRRNSGMIQAVKVKP